MNEIIIPTPTNSEVEKYLAIWDSLDNYVMQEQSLDKLFFSLIPTNVDIRDILIKASTLNDFYSTNIYSIFSVAMHILELDIDERLKSGDATIVNDISNFYIPALTLVQHKTCICLHSHESYKLNIHYLRDIHTQFLQELNNPMEHRPTYAVICCITCKN